jgi:hypothetical protein
MVGDIEGMFLQVAIPSEDTDALRYLWWEGGDLKKEPVQYQMLRHIFGAKDLPSCCLYDLQRTDDDNKKDFSPEAVLAVKYDTYVDDLLKSLDSIPQAISMITEVTELTSHGCFRITGWMSNKREVLAALPESERKSPTLNLDLDDLPVERALGILWDIEKDVFRFRILKPERPLTKQGILSTVSSLYDPIGFVCPIVLEAKRIIQDLWKQKIEWDEPVPEADLQRWER